MAAFFARFTACTSSRRGFFAASSQRPSVAGVATVTTSRAFVYPSSPETTASRTAGNSSSFLASRMKSQVRDFENPSSCIAYWLIEEYPIPTNSRLLITSSNQSTAHCRASSRATNEFFKDE